MRRGRWWLIGAGLVLGGLVLVWRWAARELAWVARTLEGTY